MQKSIWDFLLERFHGLIKSFSHDIGISLLTLFQRKVKVMYNNATASLAEFSLKAYLIALKGHRIFRQFSKQSAIAALIIRLIRKL